MIGDIYFKTAGHKARFIEAMKGHTYDGGHLDSEYGSALYILTSDYHLWEDATTYVGPHSILIEDMIEHVDLSGGFRVLVELAGNLFNGNVQVNIVDLQKLDEANLKVAFMALNLRFYRWSMSS